jgi:hypothetical protein
MHNLWMLIQENANKTTFFNGFKNLFLVATYRQSSSNIRALPMDQAWRAITTVWDDAIDMSFVPAESLRADASVTINVSHIGGGSRIPANSNGQSTPYQPTTESIWESSRKRKVEEDTEVDKRSKPGLAQSRPVFPSM